MAWTDANWVSGASDIVINGWVYRDTDQVNIANQAHAAYYLNIVMSQFWCGGRPAVVA